MHALNEALQANHRLASTNVILQPSTISVDDMVRDIQIGIIVY